MKKLTVGFPTNEKAIETELYATVTIDGYEAAFGMTGIRPIINALRAGLDVGSLSTPSVIEAIDAFEILHERMWELCDTPNNNK